VDQQHAGIAAPDTVQKLAQIWAEAMELETVRPEDDFFEIGGDSVTATIIMVHIEEMWGILLDPIEAFDRPVLKDLAALIDEVIAREHAEMMAAGSA
jgi:acyl carrier protein